jgi:hypothetical protein
MLYLPKEEDLQNEMNKQIELLKEVIEKWRPITPS